MKKRYTINRLLGIAIVAISLVASSCVGDLDRFPTNDTTNKDVYGSQEGTMQALAKVYGAWALTEGDVAGIDDGFTGFVRGFWNLQELPTDEAICAWSDVGLPDIHNLAWSSSNDFVKGLYYRSIIQIKFANEFINNVDESVVSDQQKAQMKAEARFVRAFQYWAMMDLFGNPPFITEEDPTGKIEPQQIQRADLFNYVEKELKEIEAQLPAPRKGEYGRADQGAVWALLARLYLNAEVYTGKARWADAAQYAEKVIGAGYKLKPNFEELFLADNNLNNPEVILAINFDGKKSQGWAGTTFLVNSAVNGDIGAILAEMGKPTGVTGNWGGNRATTQFGKLFDRDNDKRTLLLFTTDEIESPNKFMEGVHVYKYRNVTSTGAGGSHSEHTDIDFPLFRLAEMHLIYAEAALRGGGDKGKALKYFNDLRERAYGNSSGNVTNIKLQDVLDERARELYWEGHRRTDLIRFGQFVTDDYLWDWKGGVKAGRSVSPHLKLYPIPASDILANPKNLKQNPNY